MTSQTLMFFILCLQQAEFHHMINSMGLISVESANTSTTDMTSALFNAHLFHFLCFETNMV